MLWDLIVLVIFGAIVGWIASTLVGRSSKMGCGANVVISILGSIIGGFVVRFFFPRVAVVGRFNLYSSRGRPGRGGAAGHHWVVQKAVTLHQSGGATETHLLRACEAKAWRVRRMLPSFLFSSHMLGLAPNRCAGPFDIRQKRELSV